MSRINRTGRVVFNDASVSIWEEPEGIGIPEGWAIKFKKEVFSRIVQQLNRIGWKCEVPEEMIKQYSLSFARNFRYCRKGDLQAELGVRGRHIEFKMWQGVNTPTRPDHGGKYENDKEAIMPYLLRLEMERTRRRIRDYLCNVFASYEFKTDRADGRNNKRCVGHLTALEWVQGCYETSWHFRGDTSTYTITAGNRKSADGQLLQHGQRVWFYDRKGRLNSGITYYNINNMWWIVTGKYACTNEACFYLHTVCPDNPRTKNNARLRRSRLESELAKSIKAMNFQRAETLKRLLFPAGEQLYVVWHEDHKVYHRANFSGYTNNIIDAGKFTLAEIGNYNNETNKVIPLEKAA